MKFIFILVMVMVYQVFGWKENRIKRMPQHANYTPVTNDVAMRYLTHFGYVNPPKDTAIASLQNVSQRNLEIPLEIVIRSFQEFNNLPITGELDEATKTFMASPRCGIKDNIKNLRFNIPMPWKNQKITYAVLNTSPYLALVDFRKVIRKAFDIWSSVIPRDFEETELKNSADIKIKFLTGVHGDHPDGASENYKNQNVLAHAGVQVFSNSNSHGFVHFDTEQNWKIYKTGDKVSFLTHDVLLVAIHEIGHALE
uniref:Matrix metalloproteinase n=1 Tax=Panagrolaimus sp. ES5 TaxID=591445 RepID=A0AC34FE38_9BILA